MGELRDAKAAFIRVCAERDDLATRLERTEAAIAAERKLADEAIRNDLDRATTHTDYCYRYHPGCLSVRIRRVLDAAPTAGQPGDDAQGER